MTTNPLISVIVPVYNAERHLDTCIASVLSQTYNNFELILVNDGSSDRSGEICDDYSIVESKISVLHITNSGVTKARRAGWKHSSGTWIVFLDADDTLEIRCLETMLRHALENECDIVNACFRSIGSNRVWVHKNIGLMNRYEYMQSFAYNQTYGTVYASIYKKYLFEESSFDFDSSLKIGEDVLMCIELGLRADRVLNIEDVVYNYLDNSSSVMNRKVIHPQYLERHFEIMTNLFNRGPNLSAETEEFRSEYLCSALLKSFFSPKIPYEEYYYEQLKRRIVVQKFAGAGIKDRLLSISIGNKAVTKVLKLFIYLCYVIKHRYKGKPLTKWEIIY